MKTKANRKEKAAIASALRDRAIPVMLGKLSVKRSAGTCVGYAAIEFSEGASRFVLVMSLEDARDLQKQLVENDVTAGSIVVPGKEMRPVPLRLVRP